MYEEYDDYCEYQNEHQLYHAGYSQAYWADEDPKKCGCRGSGWSLSNIDTWHSCPIHNTGQKHPYEQEAEAAAESWWEDEKKKDVFTTEIIAVGKPFTKRSRQEKDDVL